jgi:uncharacterized membrane protein YecN with MAPEG domain
MVMIRGITAWKSSVVGIIILVSRHFQSLHITGLHNNNATSIRRVEMVLD